MPLRGGGGCGGAGVGGQGGVGEAGCGVGVRVVGFGDSRFDRRGVERRGGVLALDTLMSPVGVAGQLSAHGDGELSATSTGD